MSPSTPNIRLIYLAAIVLCIVVSLTGARGDGKAETGLKFAVVNPGKLLSEYKLTVTSDKDLKDQQDSIVTQLNSWDQHRYLAEADQVALGLVAVKEARKEVLNPADMATKQKFDDLSKRLFDEYLALQTRQGATPAETARLQELSKLEGDTSKRVKDKQARAQQDLQAQATAVRQKIDEGVRKGIVDVAKAKGLTMVFSSEVVLYCDTDLTDEVLKKINSN